MTEPCDLNATEARQLIGTKKLSPVELLDSCLQRISKTNPTLNAIVTMDEEHAHKSAKEAEDRVMSGDELGLLHGLPTAIKDLTPVKGLRTTWGSLLYEHHVPENDDPMIADMREEGGNIFAKTNTPEFGAGANTKNRVYGTTGNPFDAQKTCGGSSGGAAVSLATGMVPIANGSDYGGSLRTPASFCGIVGFRPSPGVVPSTGKVVSLNPFSVEGPMGRTVKDSHLLLQAQINVDVRDPYSSGDVEELLEPLNQNDLANLHVSFSANLDCAPIDKDIENVFWQKVKKISDCFGVATKWDKNDKHFAAPIIDETVHDAFEVIRGVNFVAAHQERLKNHRDLLGPNVIDNTERGLQYSLEDVARAQSLQTKIYYNFLEAFAKTDIIICPAASVSPFSHEQLYIEEINGEKMPTYMRWLAMTYAPTMALACSCVLPCGLDHLGMPFGIQILGPKGADKFILDIAYSLEKILEADPDTARPLPNYV